jgi:hypothetical protein
MDPDIVFEMGYGQTPDELMHDPRWRGLKAVLDKHVYTMPGTDPGALAGLIAYPDRLQPKLREVMHARLLTEFNYRLSEAQIDLLLRMSTNKDSTGYARFIQNNQATNQHEATQ